MRALILAGGQGVRLKPRFGDLPKPLAPLGGAPFLARQLEWLAAHGIARVTELVGAFRADHAQERAAMHAREES